MWCFTFSVGAVLNDFTVSVVSFDIAGTLKQKVGVALPASAAPPPKGDLTSRDSFACRRCRWVIQQRRGNFLSDWHLKSNGVVDPSVTVHPTDLGDI